MNAPYSSMERTIPATVSPIENDSIFSSHVPNNSLCVRLILSFSIDLITAFISIPTENLSLGCSILEIEIVSIGKSETIPQPISTNAPNGSKCVTLAFMTSPILQPFIY